MGGTGKTPHVAFILENTSNINTAVISRGYRRQSKNLIEGNKTLHTSNDLGDEPMELLEKFDGDDFKMIVESSRAKALKYLEQQESRTDLVVLDDGFQHQYAQSDLNVLLTEFNKPFYQDFILPLGTLRERRKGANRADIIIVTKCPENISQDDQKEIKTQIAAYSSAKVLFSRIKYKGFLDRADKLLCAHPGVLQTRPELHVPGYRQTLGRHRGRYPLGGDEARFPPGTSIAAVPADPGRLPASVQKYARF